MSKSLWNVCLIIITFPQRFFQQCLVESLNGEIVTDEEFYSDSSDDISFDEQPEKTGLLECFVRLTRMDVKFVAGFKWIGEPLGSINGKTFFNKVQTDQQLSVGDFVRLKTNNQICKVVNLYEKNFEYFAHLQEYFYGSQTILQETCNRKELFQVL